MSAIAYTDEQVLTMLHMHDNEGKTCLEIAERYGAPKNAIVGLLFRVRKQTDQWDEDGNQNGTMPAKWWKR